VGEALHSWRTRGRGVVRPDRAGLPFFASDTPEVEVVRASAETSSNDVAAPCLSATGYIVAHHSINVNSKVTGRLLWIGVEKGDKVKEGQPLVRLESEEFRASMNRQGRGGERARVLDELQHGSRPEEVQQAQHNLDEAGRRWPMTS